MSTNPKQQWKPFSGDIRDAVTRLSAQWRETVARAPTMKDAELATTAFAEKLQSDTRDLEGFFNRKAKSVRARAQASVAEAKSVKANEDALAAAERKALMARAQSLESEVAETEQDTGKVDPNLRTVADAARAEAEAAKVPKPPVPGGGGAS